MARRPASAKPATPHPATRRERLLRLLLSCVYILAIGSLIAWEYRDHLDLLSDSCEGIDAAPKSSFYNLPYNWFLNRAHEDAATPVTVVSIPQDLEEIQNNFCEGREYLADLLLAIAPQHPAEVVLDKFYSPSACASSPASTQKLAQAIRALGVPVVVGESTDLAEHERDQACLVRKPQLDFAAPNLHHGITRLNAETERIPLQWTVVPTDAQDARAELADSLSWTAVRFYDQNFAQRRRIQSLVESRLHPYARLNVDLPRQTSTNILCAVGSPETRKRWNVDCQHPSPLTSLLGKIVVIGSETEPDRREVIGVPQWGFETQARYIAAMLSGSYLRALPSWLPLLLFALFVLVIEGLPTLFEAYRPHWRKHPLLTHAFTRRRYVWVIFWTLACLLGCSFLTLLLGFLPPLALFGDICLVVVTRLLFFLAESVEAPLLHHETKGHAHVPPPPSPPPAHP